MALDITIFPNNFGMNAHYGDPEFDVRPFATDRFLLDTVGPGKLHYLSHAKFGLPVIIPNRNHTLDSDFAYPIPTTWVGMQAAHACFATHRPFGLNPDVIWQVIVQQLAEHIKLDPSRYANLFTWFPGEKVNIRVRDDALLHDNNWLRALGMFEDPLRFAIGDELVSLLVPTFSTTTQIDRVAALVTLMDAASPFYDYTVDSMCHIPRVRLEGTAADWRQLYERANRLGSTFTALAAYFDGLLPVLQEIAETAAGKHPDDTFWNSLYKYDASSKTDYVSGWITTLLAHKYTSSGPVLRENFSWGHHREGIKTNEVASLLSTVSFVWNKEGTEIPMTFVAGTLGVDTNDGVFTPRLGVAVMER